MSVIPDADLYARLRDVLSVDWHFLPDTRGYRGTGGPGLLLEKLLGLDGSNRDSPDAGKWEIKYHSPKTRLLTLFHLEGEPKKHLHHMIRKFGWEDDKGRTSFRHTIHRGRSSLSFYVADENDRIVLRHPDTSDITLPYWTHDRLLNAFCIKTKAVDRGSREKSVYREG